MIQALQDGFDCQTQIHASDLNLSNIDEQDIDPTGKVIQSVRVRNNIIFKSYFDFNWSGVGEKIKIFIFDEAHFREVNHNFLLPDSFAILSLGGGDSFGGKFLFSEKFDNEYFKVLF